MFHIQREGAGSNVPRTIRFTEELFETLNQVAQESHVSFNSLVLQCCQYALENLEEE